ncbi:MAG: CRTAC1 family protein [Acidimicrobiia bacterium]
MARIVSGAQQQGKRCQMGPAVKLRRGSGPVWLAAGLATGSGVTIALVLLVRSISGPATAAAFEPPGFVEEAAAAGVDHIYDGEFTFFVGGGVAVFDCNDDGKPDIFFAGGTNAAALYRNDSPIGGDLRFAELPHRETDLTEVTGAYPLDIDGDGRIDLAVLRLGENVLLRGLGDCRFERANEAWAFDGGNAWTTAFSAKWEGSASLPTMAFGNYVALSETGRQTGTCSDNALFRPDEPRTSYSDPIPLTPGWCTLSILFSDWDRSGRRDLRMTNDRHYYRDGEEQLWRVAEGEHPRLYTHDEGWQKLQIWGMGIASYDLTGDGLPEVFLTSQGDNKLQALAEGAAGPNYVDIAIRRGVTAHRPFTGEDVMPSTAWHAEFQDVNNDGWVDLFIAKGNVEAMPEFATRDPNNLLLGQPDGTFREGAEAAGIVSFARGRGAALADFNLDGMLDLVVVNRREAVKLWRSVGWGEPEQPAPMGDWISVRLEQPSPNRDGVGSWIEVRVNERTFQREVTVGGGHAGGQLGWIHFGLGDANDAEIRVQWPDREKGPWLTVTANQFMIVERGASQVRTWLPPRG